MKKYIVLSMLVCGSVYAADAASQVNTLTEMVPSSGVAVGILALVLEFGLRFTKTTKPASLFYTAAALIKALGALFTKVGNFLDLALQNVKAPVDQPVQSTEQKSA